ncbi:hypothetical protein A3L04_09935 [Thermococcus chitonophagus]|uniref:Uncharacterized protein n=1 Tax=Thermococcus chitonophagus TaxID=54262 RepID=A0A160VSW5_9EURY|nr:hypothetical protein [Thermococcus chitonophagus]ASJ17367.1 hypothetical protein A3L04_09935 [Thermococcus chitonophagus]CUX78002.1 hypothetical protein CHITON_1223 [Thermococcus chitonophagus]
MKMRILTIFILAVFLLQFSHGVILIPLSLLSIFSFSLGAVFLAILGAYLIATGATGILGVMTMALALLAVEVGELERIKAPASHYLIATLSVGLAIPLYLITLGLSTLKFPLDVTWIAVVFAFALYIFIRQSLFNG